jgi:cyclase
MMKTATTAALFLLFTPFLTAAPAKFQKLTDHYYVYPGGAETGNVGAFVSDDGLLLVNAAAPSEMPQVLEALKRTSMRQIRWVVGTEYRKETWAWPAPLLTQGASLLTSKGVFLQAAQPPAAAAGCVVFGRQMRLYPGGIEVKVLAPEGKSRTGDVVVFVPSERVLQVGDMFQAGSFPVIAENAGEGAALGWIDELKQVIDFVPLLKSAMPQQKADLDKLGPEEKEKTLEELVIVIPGHGAVANLQDMKDLLEQAQKLRAEMVRAVGAGRSRDSILASGALAPFRAVANFESFAGHLYEALAAPKP